MKEKNFIHKGGNMRSVLMFGLLLYPLFSENLRVYQYSGVEITYVQENNQTKKITVEREIDPKCLNIPITNEIMWENHYVSSEIPEPCRAMFITSVGQIQPIQLHPKIETFGELETLHYLKQMQNDPNKLLVDTRLENWYQYRTIPGAINIPYNHISHNKSFPEEFKEALAILNVEEKKEKYDFSRAKTIALFCNGSWCSQSSTMIKHLLKMGYPPEKIKWYRGGMHDWLMLNMTSTMEN